MREQGIKNSTSADPNDGTRALCRKRTPPPTSNAAQWEGKVNGGVSGNFKADPSGKGTELRTKSPKIKSKANSEGQV